MIASPAIGMDGTVYTGAGDQKVYALDGQTGAKKWEFETGDSWPVGAGFAMVSPSIGAEGTVYVGSHVGQESKVYALDGNTGAKQRLPSCLQAETQDFVLSPLLPEAA